MSRYKTSSHRCILLITAAALAAALLFTLVPGARAGTLRVSWDSVSADDLAGYRLRYGTDGVSFDAQVDVPNPAAVSRDVDGLAVGTTYYFVVQAYDESVNYSPYSAVASATVVPWAGHAAAPGLDPALVSLSSPLFELSWDVSAFADVAGAGLEVSKVNGGFANPNGAEWDPDNCCFASATLLDGVSGTEVIDASGFEGPGVYQIRVVGLDAFGTIATHFSDSATFEVLAGAPPVDPDTSTVTAAPAEIPADGESVSLITVTPMDASSAPSGPGLTVTLETTAGTLLGTVQDNGDGTYTQQLQSSLEVTTAQVSAVAGGVALTRQASVAFAGIPAMIVTGPGPGPDNPPQVRVFDPATGQPAGLDFMAYGVARWGVNVGAGDVTGDGRVEILTGPGPGSVFGPQVRVFDDRGQPFNTFMAYGTMRWGAKVSAADIDGDHVDEILTSPGPGEVFGPHIRAFDFDGSSQFVPIEGVSYFSYGTLKYGANVAGGDIDGDGIDEIVTGPGPGTMFASHVRAFDYDGEQLVPIAGVSFNAFDAELKYGVNVACGDLDGDGIDEILTGPGPGAEDGYTARVLAWNYDGGTLEQVQGLDILAYEETVLHGVKLAAGPIDVDRAAVPPAGGGALAMINEERKEGTDADADAAGLLQ